MKLSRIPLNDIVVDKVKSKMKLKRRITLEVVNSYFASIGIIKQKPALDFRSVGVGCQLVMRIKKEVLADLTVPMGKLKEFLESVVLRFRKLHCVNISSYKRDLTIAVLDSLVSIASTFSNMEIRRFSTVKDVDKQLLPSFFQAIGQFAGGLRRLKLHLLAEQFPALYETIQAVGLCQNIRHLDLIFLTYMDTANCLDMLMSPAQDSSANPSKQRPATTFSSILTTLSHLHTLRLMVDSAEQYLGYDYPRPASRRTLTISEAWLSFIHEPAINEVVGKMENFEMHMRDLPLSERNLALLSQLLESMPPTTSFNFHEQKRGQWLLTPMNTVLANWLRLAKQAKKHVLLNTCCPLPTAEQLTNALETLPVTGIVESNVVAQDCHFYFQFGNGGRLTVQCEEEEDDDEGDEFFDEGRLPYYYYEPPEEYGYDENDDYYTFDYTGRRVYPFRDHRYGV